MPQKTIGGHIMKHHMVAGAEGARHHVVRGGRRPPLIMWPPFFFFGFGQSMFFGLWAIHVFSAFGQSMFFSAFGPSMFFQLLAPIVLRASQGKKSMFFQLPCSFSEDPQKVKRNSVWFAGHPITKGPSLTEDCMESRLGVMGTTMSKCYLGPLGPRGP